MADDRPDWMMGALAGQDAYPIESWPDEPRARITVRPQMEVAPPKSFEDYLGEATQPREADTLQRPPVFGLTNRYVDPNDPSTQAGAQRLSNYYGLPGRLLAGDRRNVIQPEVPGQWSDRDEARAALQAGNMTLGGMGMGVDATTGAMPRGFAGTANTLGVGGGRPPRIGDVADLSGLSAPGVTVGRPAQAAGYRAANESIGPEGPTALDLARQEGYGGGEFTGSGKRGAAYLDDLIARLREDRGVPRVSEVPTLDRGPGQAPEAIRRTVDYRDPSGRPTRTAPLPIGTEDRILAEGEKAALGQRPVGPQPPLMQAAERKGPVMGGVADLTTPQGIRAYHGSPHDFERFDINKIGTGEGAQAYGHGLYFAEAEPTALSYKNATRVTDMDWPVAGTDLKVPAWVARSAQTPRGLEEVRQNFVGRVEEAKQQLAAGDHNASERLYHTQRIVNALDAVKAGAPLKKPGHMYEVNINARPEQFLNWDAPLSRQAPEVQGALSGFGFKARPEEMRSFDDALLAALQDKGPMTLPRQPADPAGEKIYSDLINQSGMTASRARASQAERSSMLREAGIPGIRYLDQGSRFAVDPKLISDVQRRIAYANEIGASPEAMQKLATELAGYQAKLAAQTSNYVLFDDKLIDILRKYGIAGMLGGGAAATMGSTARQDQYAQ